MCQLKPVSPHKVNKKDLEDTKFFELALKHMVELAGEAGDWRNHLPYEALVSYREDAAVRKQYEGHLKSCAYCQEAMDALGPCDRS